eukprot:TRINITY_DN6032_c0_g1_i5.p1 TRINITY_DN6032_c0_g1~~TRINITY_DN6032_c0_g1_i5.p1  ORF type:complete len:369 (+),score=53.27 TRINITY_DN6032_c0_g1_i5:366-1472(+)
MKHSKSVVSITVCDFDMSQKILAIGLKDGGVKIINMETLSVKDVFIYDGEMEEEFPAATAVSCRVKDRVVVGYEDGKMREFVLTDPSQFVTFVPKIDESVIHSPVAFLNCVAKNSLILATYNLNRADGRIFGYKFGSTAPSYITKHSAGLIIGASTLDRIQILVTLSDTNNELGIYDYLNGEQLITLRANIPTITDKSPITAFALLAVTKQVWEIYVEETEVVLLDQPEKKAKGDIIAFGLANGTVLTAYLVLKIEKGKLVSSILPQKIYKAQESGDLPLSESAIKCLHIDAVTDYVLAGDGRGNVVAFDRAVMQVLNPKRAEELETSAKSQGWLGNLWGSSGKAKGSSPKKEDPMELQLEEMPKSNK